MNRIAYARDTRHGQGCLIGKEGGVGRENPARYLSHFLLSLCSLDTFVKMLLRWVMSFSP